MHRQMADVMKMMGQNKRGGLAGALGNMFGLGGGGGMPEPTPEMIAEMQKKLGGAGGMPGGGGLPPLPPGLSGPGKPGLPGLGGPKIPGFPGGFPFGGKKK
jgi:signal recognition particle subunit SRP54